VENQELPLRHHQWFYINPPFPDRHVRCKYCGIWRTKAAHFKHFNLKGPDGNKRPCGVQYEAWKRRSADWPEDKMCVNPQGQDYCRLCGDRMRLGHAGAHWTDEHHKREQIVDKICYKGGEKRYKFYATATNAPIIARLSDEEKELGLKRLTLTLEDMHGDGLLLPGDEVKFKDPGGRRLTAFMQYKDGAIRLKSFRFVWRWHGTIGNQVRNADDRRKPGLTYAGRAASVPPRFATGPVIGPKKTKGGTLTDAE